MSASLPEPEPRSPPTSRASSLGIGGAFSLGVAASALTAIGGLVRTRIVANLLGPAGIGITSEITQIATTALTPVSVVQVPLVSAVAKEHQGRPEATNAQAAWDTSVTLTTVLVVASLACGWSLRSYVVADAWGPYGALGLALAVVAAGATALGGLGAQALAAVTALRAQAAYTSIAVLASVLVVGACAWIDGLRGFFVGTAIAAVVPVLALPFLLRRAQAPLVAIGRPRLASSFLGEALRVGVPSLAVAVTGQGAMTYLREYLRTHLGVEANGYFQASLGFDTLIVASTLQTLGNYVFPRYAAADGVEALRREVLAAGDFVMRIMPPAVLVGIGARGLILRTLFGPEFIEAESILGLYLVADIARAVSWTQGGALIYRKSMTPFVVTNVLFWVAFTANVWLLEPRFGLAGVGLAYCVGVIIQAVLTGLSLTYVLGVQLPAMRYARWMGATLLAAGALAAGQRIPYADPVVVLVGIVWAWSNGTLREGYRWVAERLARKMGAGA